jgi:hypothetical protein
MLGLFTLILGVTQTAPMASTADIHGRVLDDVTFAPVAGARVFLYPVSFPTGHKPKAAIADQNGEYSFIGIPEGNYHLGLSHEEYFSTDMSWTTVRLRGGERRDVIDLLKRAPLAGELDEALDVCRELLVRVRFRRVLKGGPVASSSH